MSALRPLPPTEAWFTNRRLTKHAVVHERVVGEVVTWCGRPVAGMLGADRREYLSELADCRCCRLARAGVSP